jgi:endoglucanase
MRHLNCSETSKLLLLGLWCISLGSCGGSNSSSDSDQIAPATLSVSKNTYSIAATDSKVTINVKASDTYYVKSKSSWVMPNTSSGTTSSTFELSVAENAGYMERIDTLILSMGKLTQNVYIVQGRKTIPAIAADKTGMTDNAMTVVHHINVGWNLGNTCESNNGKYFDAANFSGSETSWGNPRATLDMITAVKVAGFNAIRIPVCWGAHISDKSNWTINPTWMARVKEIVDYAYNQGMYVILNSHHDGWFEFDCNAKDSAYVRPRAEAMWTQIALTFRDYDEHLIFSGMNEPHQDNDWNRPSDERAAVQSVYEQKFVSAVRATGGKNAYRCLMVQPWCCNPSFYTYFTRPVDTVENRMILEFHYYVPWNYCGTDDATAVRFWGDDYKSYGVSSYGTADMIRADFLSLKTNYIDKGIPVVLGEFGVNRHVFTASEETSGLYAKGVESRNNYLKWLVSAGKSYGFPSFYWDNGALGSTQNTTTMMKSGSDAFALFDRKSSPAMSVYDAGAVAAIMEGAKTPYP